MRLGVRMGVMSNAVATKKQKTGGVDGEYTITYCKEAFRLLDDLTMSYNLSRKETLGFALSVLRRLKEDGVVSLKHGRL